MSTDPDTTDPDTTAPDTTAPDMTDPDTTDTADTADAPSFGDALEELETILRRIDEDDVDIDRLADELRRATELLELCRGKIRRAELEVEQIVQTLDS